MKRFISTELFHALREASQKGIEADAQVLENGYDEFALLLFTESAACTDRVSYYRSLAYARLELASLKKGAGEKYSLLS